MKRYSNYMMMIALLLIAVSCGSADSDGGVCSTEVVTGMLVLVTDEDGNEIGDAMVTVADGDYTETLSFNDSYWSSGDDSTGAYVGAEEREGTYTLTVEKEGYVTHTEEAVVTSGTCHVTTEEITVTLEEAT